jgi:hypothetical protein
MQLAVERAPITKWEKSMKLSRLASTLVLASMCASGIVMAQQTKPNMPTTPSTTPDDTTATPPNNGKVPPGTPAPPPYSSTPSTTTPGTRDSSGSDLKNEKGKPRQPSDMGNTNTSPAPYPDTGKK